MAVARGAVWLNLGLVERGLFANFDPMTLRELLHQNYPVGDAAVEAMEEACRKVSVRRGESVIRQGAVCEGIIFVTDGLFRVVFRHDLIEETVCFGMTGDPFTSMHSFYRGEPSQYSFEAIEDSECLLLDFDNFRRLQTDHPDILKWMVQLLSEQIYAFERRYVYLGINDAYTRYATFLQLRQDIINRIPLKYIAQYIKVKPETLSRIRARYARGRQ